MSPLHHALVEFVPFFKDARLFCHDRAFGISALSTLHLLRFVGVIAFGHECPLTCSLSSYQEERRVGRVTLLMAKKKKEKGSWNHAQVCHLVSLTNTPIWDMDVGVGGLEMMDQSFEQDRMFLMTS
ncbi:hypothetical protein CDAR_246291 [Caerostris darwini]|uniref:Uncharacterized protein n=1 Tax=Caerostris darwini TaxID=1538125 RepID=A0AAV4W900_9ARAC|nr:hypothetical protein CDAR_246291 [Caerostris darwini]